MPLASRDAHLHAAIQNQVDKSGRQHATPTLRASVGVPAVHKMICSNYTLGEIGRPVDLAQKLATDSASIA